EIVGSAMKSLEALLPSNEVQLQLPQELILLQADGPLLERVFVNLLENAIKYASGEKGEIGIRAQALSGQIKVEVWDNGPGLPPGKEKQLFDKFTRGTTESAIPGVGMGLAICRTIVEMHRGEIHAHNRPEGGACFTFTLPLPAAPVLTETVEENP
ncbi:TPA: ATP-binding protein, partial [Klebsiella pneumoniae]